MFCNISGDTLTDSEFFPQFLDYMQHNRDLAGQIVFEFGQDALVKAGCEGRGEFGLPRKPGLRAVDGSHRDAGARFRAAEEDGFKHIKLRADTLLGGMGTARAAVGPEDFKKLLERHGLNLIVERVEDEKTVVQLLDYAVDFAQGYLFGEPRAVRDDTIKALEKSEPSAPIIPFRKSA